MTLHLMLEVFAAAFTVVPLVAIWLALRRQPSPRLTLALIAFVVLEARLIAMVVIHTVLPVEHVVEELLEFGGDLAVIAAFAAAFLYGTRWSPERVRVKPA